MATLFHRSNMANESTEMVARQPENGTFSGEELQATNSYVTKKTAAQGMLDFALLMSNASQLNALFGIPGDYLTGLHYALFVLIFLSIILQVVAGVLICILGFRSMRNQKERQIAEILNNTVVIMILLITIVNVFINALEINSTGK